MTASDSVTCASAARRGVSATVFANSRVCVGHYYLDLIVDGMADSQAGQFVQIRCADEDDKWSPKALTWSEGMFPAPHGADWSGPAALLRRPFSIADHWRDERGRDHILIIHHAIGPGTHWLAQLRGGRKVDLIGPLGRGFTMPESPAVCVLLGGGVGIPPLISLSRSVGQCAGTAVVAIFGARTASALPLKLTSQPDTTAQPAPCAEFGGRTDVPTIIATDDGSLGFPGRVTDAFEAWFDLRRANDRGEAKRDRHPPPQACNLEIPIGVLACGPEPMLRAAARMTRRLGLPCQLCIERLMGCGLGTCQSCVVRRTDTARGSGWRYALTCQDGPVFDRDDLFDMGDARDSL